MEPELGPSPLTAEERIDLVAYLDGELDEAGERAVTAILTHNEAARRELDALERTWELLDYLPRPKASEDLLSRTLMEIDPATTSHAGPSLVVGLTSRRWARALVFAGVMAATLALSYSAARWGWPNPTARLTRDLSLAEHWEEYREAGSFEFLKQLEQSSEFDDAD